jgi:hypothetical protein
MEQAFSVNFAGNISFHGDGIGFPFFCGDALASEVQENRNRHQARIGRKGSDDHQAQRANAERADEAGGWLGMG